MIQTDYAQYDYSILSGAAIGLLQYCDKAEALGLMEINGGLTIDNCLNAKVTVEASGSASSALTISNVHTANASLNANGCSATPLTLTSIHDFNHSGLTGINPGTTYGMQVGGGGQYIITGATIAGSNANQFTIEGVAGPYSDLSANGAYALRGTFLHWGSGYTVWQGKMKIPFLGGDELSTNDLIIGGQTKAYGLYYPLSPAYQEITAFAGGGQSSATLIGYQRTIVTSCANDHDSIRVFGSSDITIVGGLEFVVTNSTSKLVDVYPPTGKRIYFNSIDTGLNNPITMNAGDKLVFGTDNNGNYHCATTSVNGYTGALIINAGPNVTINSGSNIISISSSAGGSSSTTGSYNGNFTGTFSGTIFDLNILNFTQSINIFTASQLLTNADYESFSGAFAQNLVNVGDGRYLLTSQYNPTALQLTKASASFASMSFSQSVSIQSLQSFTASYNTGSFTGTFTGDGSQLTRKSLC
jgi:hypothetical protein